MQSHSFVHARTHACTLNAHCMAAYHDTAFDGFGRDRAVSGLQLEHIALEDIHFPLHWLWLDSHKHEAQNPQAHEQPQARAADSR